MEPLSKKMKKTLWCGMIAVMVLGTLWHFGYEVLGETRIAGYIFPVNESTWEHMKLAFYPMLLFHFVLCSVEAVHQNRRWDEDFLTIKKILDSGKLSEVFRIESRVHGSRGIPGDWRQVPEQGGGMVLDWGVHLFDQALLLYPGVKVKKVYATLTNVTNQLVDDGFYATITFENGVEMLVEVGTSNFVNLPRWYVLGTDGTAVIEDWNLNGRVVSAKGQTETDVVPVITAAGLTKTMAPRKEENIHTDELPKVESDIKDFYNNVMAVIEGKAESFIKLDEVARVMRLMEAVFESAAKKQVIDFE